MQATKAKARNVDMTKGPLTKNILIYTIPIILTSILQLVFNAADLIMVGQQSGGEIFVAAVGCTGTLIALIVNFFIGLSVGTGVSVAQGIGAKDNEAVHRAVHTAIPVAIISGIFITIFGILSSEKILIMMNVPQNVLPLSVTYIKIYFAGTLFIMIYNFCAAILRAVGDTRSPLVFLIVAGVLNVILNYIFVYIFDMNVAGVALATTISQGVSATLVVVALMKRNDACKLKFSKLKIYKKPLMHILIVGLPAAIQSSLFNISNTLIQASINSFGDIVVSGHSAASNIEGFVYAIINAFHQTAINFISQNMGAKNYDRVKEVFRKCLMLVLLTGVVSGTLIVLFGRTLLSFYIPASPEAIEWGMVRLVYICLPFFMCGLMDVATSSLRGIGLSVTPMAITVVGVCGMRILWIFTIFQIPAFHTPESLYTSYVVTWTITFIAEYIVFKKEYKKLLKEN